MNARTGTIALLLVSAVLITGLFVYNRQGNTPAALASSTLATILQPSPTAVAEASSSPAPPATEAIVASPSPASPSSAAAPASPLVAPSSVTPTLYDYRIVNIFPHDRNAFTQGLVYRAGVLYEGTGLYGRSSLRKVELESGGVLQQHDLDEMFFGEGIAVIGDKIYQLTWQNGVGFVYDRASFRELQQFTYTTEGWGLTYDGQQLIMSDGTPNIYFLDPTTLQETRRITVTVEGELLPR
ncbi:MAG: glutaminyl-peptide cyclotransferase, partial [Caldilinea sp.]